jgi:hypothetical protein
LDRSAVQAIADRELGPLMGRLGLERWDISVYCDLKADEPGAFGTRGQCTWQADYDTAVIRLAPDNLNTEAEVIEVLRHELFHAVLAPISIFKNAIRPALAADETKWAMADSVFTHTVERLVIGLERMYRGLTAGVPEAPPAAREGQS